VEGAAHHAIEMRVRVGGLEDMASSTIAPEEAMLAGGAPLERRLAFDPGLLVRWQGGAATWSDVFGAILFSARAKNLLTVPFELRVSAYDRYGAIAGRSEWTAVYLVVE
jgi:hypothetical protein